MIVEVRVRAGGPGRAYSDLILLADGHLLRVLLRQCAEILCGAESQLRCRPGGSSPRSRQKVERADTGRQEHESSAHRGSAVRPGALTWPVGLRTLPLPQ